MASQPLLGKSLTNNQQDLLLAALNSQAEHRGSSNPQGTSGPRTSVPDMATLQESGLYISPQQATLDSFDDFSPDLDYLDGDGFDFESADLGGEMIGGLPGGLDGGSNLHDKRKNSDDSNGSDEGDAKRQEFQDGEKSSKKPGRKPLTSEPTTVSRAIYLRCEKGPDSFAKKRKAQNRAAQRAFRERKEAHLKDLETKVNELTKTQEDDKRENGLLKAQVERMKGELKEYRKRLSLNGTSGANRSPPQTAYGTGRSNSKDATLDNGFNFDFPAFGSLPGSQIFGNQTFTNGSTAAVVQRNSATPPNTTSTINGSFSSTAQQQSQTNSRQNSMGRSQSPGNLGLGTTTSPVQMTGSNATFATYSTMDNMHGFATTLAPSASLSNDPFGDLFSPSILRSGSMDGPENYFAGNTQTGTTLNTRSTSDPHGGDTTAGLNRVFQFNSNSSGGSDSASPSASSGSQWNGQANSSTGTSPEPSHGSPGTKLNDKFTNTQRQTSPLAVTNQVTDNNDIFNTTDYSLPSVNIFDPMLFGDYRESQDAIIGGGDFTGGFFEDALQPFDYNSPSNLFGILQSPQPMTQQLPVNNNVTSNAPITSANLMAEMDKTCGGGDDDYGLPNTTKISNSPPNAPKTEEGKYISCNNIW